MGELRSYPKVYNLGHKAIADLLRGSVVVQEKIDGSQFSFGLAGDIGPYEARGAIANELRMRSRSAIIDPNAPPKLFARGVEAVQKVAALLHPGWAYRGELLDKPKHNTLAYDRVPANNVILFDVDRGGEDYLTPIELQEEAARLGFEAVPVVYVGAGSELVLDEMRLWLERISCLGGQKYEGVVIKAYGLFGRDGKTLMGKHVSEAFKETHKGAWKAANPSRGDIILDLGKRFRTPARWDKAVQHLREAGVLQDAPQDIGPLLVELRRDLEDECGAEIKEALFKLAFPKIARIVADGVPQWYKLKLVEQQFETTQIPEAAVAADADNNSMGCGDL